MDDITVAAAAAGRDNPSRIHRGYCQDTSAYELPSVDDLEVAAAAAAAALEALAAGACPAGLGGGHAATSSSVDSDEEEDVKTSTDMKPLVATALAAPPLHASFSPPEQHVCVIIEPLDSPRGATADSQRLCTVCLRVEHGATDGSRLAWSAGDGTSPMVVEEAVRAVEPVDNELCLAGGRAPRAAAGGHASVGGANRHEDGSCSSRSGSSTSSSDSDADGVSSATSSEGPGEPLDYKGMRDLISAAYKQADDDEEGGAAAPREALHQALGLPEMNPLGPDVVVSPEDVLTPAGTISAVVDGMVIVQSDTSAGGNGVLAEGSVLVLEDRTPVGRVEEVFGPITAPLYALRWAGSGQPPAALAPGARMHALPRLAEVLQLQDVARAHASGGIAVPRRAAGCGPTLALEDEFEVGSDGEYYFSDDEAEAAWHAAQATRKRPSSAQEDAPQQEQGTRGRVLDRRSVGSVGHGGVAATGRHGRDRSGSGGSAQGGRAMRNAAGSRGRGRGGQARGGREGWARGPHAPSLDFQATATAGQLSTIGLQHHQHHQHLGQHQQQLQTQQPQQLQQRHQQHQQQYQEQMMAGMPGVHMAYYPQGNGQGPMAYSGPVRYNPVSGLLQAYAHPTVMVAVPTGPGEAGQWTTAGSLPFVAPGSSAPGVWMAAPAQQHGALLGSSHSGLQPLPPGGHLAGGLGPGMLWAQQVHPTPEGGMQAAPVQSGAPIPHHQPMLMHPQQHQHQQYR